MKILFIVSEIILSEPLGIMQLSAICKKHGHQTRLISLKKHKLVWSLDEYKPQLIAYSTMSGDVNVFIEADEIVRRWSMAKNHKVTRIMGGPHPTFFPEILDQCSLDGICIGEGDLAIVEILKRVDQNKDLANIPNVLCTSGQHLEKQLVLALDELPFLDRTIFYEAARHYQLLGLRSVLTSRGCPYTCTYCFNHVFNKMFQDVGPILRRRSVDNVMQELQHIVKNYPPVKMFRFSDDTFAHKIDDWLIEFLDRYKKEINLPFYCAMRSNALTNEMARRLAAAGCISINMAIETGNEKIRNTILKRHLSDDVIIQSFANAKKYKINVFANTIFGFPGTTLQDDLESFEFARKLKPGLASFSIFCPYPKLELTEYALKNGFFAGAYPEQLRYVCKSALTSLTEQEKSRQLRLSYLAGSFCYLPETFKSLLCFLIKIRLDSFYCMIGWCFVLYRFYFVMIPNIYPRNMFLLLKVFFESMFYGSPRPRKL